MTATTVPETPARKRDAAQTRQDLLDAARELFGAKGYDRTSLREIGERAGVDAALIARYFGNKMALYSATVEADTAGTPRIASVADIEAGRRLGENLNVMQNLTPDYRADVAKAAAEIAALRATGRTHPGCAAERRALEAGL